MPLFEVNFEVFCECGVGLRRQSTTDNNRHGGHTVTVEPCGGCLKKARDEGYAEGRDDGYSVGYDAGVIDTEKVKDLE